MRRGDYVSAVLFLLFGGCLALQASRLPYELDGVPGPGFAPFWIGVMTIALSVCLLASIAVGSPTAAARLLPSGAGARRLGGVVVALIVAVALMQTLGFFLSVVGFMAITLPLLERRSVLAVAVLALATAGLLYFVFGLLLKIPFPTGVLGM